MLAAVTCIAGGALAGCAPVFGPRTGEPTPAFACSRFNPSLQTSVLEAVVMGGGPLAVDVAGWTCGNADVGSVRIVLLRYRQREAGGRAVDRGTLVPVVFEDGRLVASGWHLLETQPNRYGVGPVPDRRQPWRVPRGWCGLRLPEGG